VGAPRFLGAIPSAFSRSPLQRPFERGTSLAPLSFVDACRLVGVRRTQRSVVPRLNKGEVLLSSTSQKSPDPVHAGLFHCIRGEWHQGLAYLEQARKEKQEASLPSIYFSYLGHAMARCCRSYESGLALCEHALELEFFRPENHLNLASILALKHDRAGAYRAMKEGLRLSPRHRGLLALELRLGRRQPAVIGFLGRDHGLNRWLGRMRHEHQQGRAA
jgi:hypothetical protein